MKKILFSILFFFLAMPLISEAASLSLKSSKTEYSLGDSFTVSLFLDINDVCVNTVEAQILFPPNILRIESFISGDSLINIWVDEPSQEDIFDANDTGELYIAGGIPGGYCGKIPGDPGDSNLVGRILFRIPGFYVGDTIPENLEIKIGEASVYVNDGLGTKDKLRKDDLSIVLKKTPGTEIGEYDSFIKGDTIKPEPFVVTINQSPDIFQGQYFAIFSTLDKQSGIDRYEVLEAKSLSAETTLTEKLIEFFIKPKEAEWKSAESPYLLSDQSLRSIIKVRAIDRAGNERLVEYIPQEPNIAKSLDYDYLIIATAVVLLLIILFFLYKILRFFIIKKKNSNKNI